ncbi:MAG TPA: plastocyanin/azurin family copper-binding protein [Candidatus Dormibacteraeota bacterium]|nr:plastocyanin/azurin family copper-binding protein [Candidatus Dormibacteraeota bacterium]
MMKARLGVACLGVATSLLFAACGNGPPAGEGGGGGGGGNANVGTVVSSPSGSTTFDETDALKFSPTSATVKVGDTVIWSNGSSVAHNVTFDSYSSITSPTMNGGDKFGVKFTVAGTYQFHCTFHPGMDGTITVSG